MYAYPNKDRLKQHLSQEFRLKKREEMHDVLMEGNIAVTSDMIKLISKGDLFNTTQYTYMGEPMYTIDYIIDTVKRQSEINDRYNKTMKDVAQMKHGHWFFGLFH